MENNKVDCKGLIQINRSYGGRNVLFGSNIPHDTCMKLTISQAYISRSFNENHYYPTNKIIEIELYIFSNIKLFLLHLY